MRSSGFEEDQKGQCVSRVIALFRAVIYTVKVLAAFFCYFISTHHYSISLLKDRCPLRICSVVSLTLLQAEGLIIGSAEPLQLQWNEWKLKVL